jgi:hypothetical protein
MGTGVCSQGLAFARQTLYHLNHVLALFCFSYILDRIAWFCLEPVSACNAPIYGVFFSWDHSCMSPCLSRLAWNSETDILLISVSCITEIIGVRYPMNSADMDGYLSRHKCVFSTQENRPLWNKISILHLENSDCQEVFLSKTNSILTRKKMC